MNRTAIAAIAAFGAASIANAASVSLYNLGPVGPGTSIAAPLTFDDGSEAYVGFMELTESITAGSGLGFSLWTEGEADTEVAIYGPRGLTLVGCNDDGDSGSWGDPGLDSRLHYGDAEGSPTNGDGYNGTTNPSGLEFTNVADLPAGHYTIVLGTFSVVWDDLDATASVEGFRDTGGTIAHLDIFSIE